MDRTSAGRLVSFLALSFAPALSAAPLPQVIPRPYNQRHADRYATGDLSRYEGQYGPPEFRGIDDEHGRPWPRMQSIRTVALLAPSARSGDPGAMAYAGREVEYVDSYTNFMLCGERYCVGVTPVEEMFDVFNQQGRAWQHRKVEVIGAIDNVGDPRDSACPCYALRVWSVQLYAESDTRRPAGQGSSLEALVRGPEAAAGRSITVQGTFRGGNLFEDLPPETRRDSADWVLKDGPFSIWVTGRAPKGDGFSLDPRSRSDCRWRLEVTGKVETAARYVYLRAKSIALVRREKDEADER
jgi:hypothetical protein